jgi:hypothetical protein
VSSVRRSSFASHDHEAKGRMPSPRASMQQGWAKARLMIRAHRNVGGHCFRQQAGAGRLVSAEARTTVRRRRNAKSGGEAWSIALEAASHPRYLREGDDETV